MYRIINNSQRFGLALLVLFAMIVESPAAPAASTQALQRLTNDLALQLELTYRHDRTANRERYEELAKALAAWNRSPRSDADFALMEAWLRTAIRDSMPGDGKALPATPSFSVPMQSEAPRAAVGDDAARGVTPPAPKTVVVSPKVPTPAPVAPQPKPTAVAAKPIPTTPPAVAVKPAPRDFWSNHPATKPLDLGNPFRDDPTPQPRPEQTIVVAAKPPVVRSALRLPVVEASEIAVNLPELSSRIDGYNQALRRVEAAVIAADRPDARELAQLFTDLEQLADQRDFIELYVVGLAPHERQTTPELDSTDAALSLLEEKLTAQFGSPGAENSSTNRDILLVLTQKLAELKRGLPPTP